MGKKVLITGAGGFIGSHLAETCVKEGYSVRAFIHYNSKNSWGFLEESPFRDEIEFVTGDVRDFDSVTQAVSGCQEVFHLAALIGIPYSYQSPLAYVKTNVEGTYNVCQAARQHGVDNLLVTSTSETFGTAQYVPMDEDHPKVGQSPYAATKIGADQLALSYHKSFGLPVKVVRPFNTFGPRQSARAIIPTIISQILKGERQLQLGSLTPTRDFTYVKDTARGFLAIAASDELIGEDANIGMNQEISIGDLVETIAHCLGVSVEVKQDPQRVRAAASEVNRLVCNNQKLLRLSAWQPEYSFEQGLHETIEWVKANLSEYKTIYNV